VSAFLFQMEPHSPIVSELAAGLLVLAGLMAGFIPARRAAGVDPVTALR